MIFQEAIHDPGNCVGSCHGCLVRSQLRARAPDIRLFYGIAPCDGLRRRSERVRGAVNCFARSGAHDVPSRTIIPWCQAEPGCGCLIVGHVVMSVPMSARLVSTNDERNPVTAVRFTPTTRFRSLRALTAGLFLLFDRGALTANTGGSCSVQRGFITANGCSTCLLHAALCMVLSSTVI